jgi:hypothetical protein
VRTKLGPATTQRHCLFPLVQRFFGRYAGLAGIAALGFAASPALAATDLGKTETCANSTDSIQHLATVDDARGGNFQCLGLSLEGGRVKAIRLETHSFESEGPRAEPRQVKIAEFPLATVESSHGAVLDGVSGHDAIILRGHFPTPQGQTALVISYLYNGFTGEYRSCSIILDRGPNAGWRLSNSLHHTIGHIVVRTRRIPVLGMFGIANLEGACTQLDR